LVPEKNSGRPAQLVAAPSAENLNVHFKKILLPHPEERGRAMTRPQQESAPKTGDPFLDSFESETIPMDDSALMNSSTIERRRRAFSWEKESKTQMPINYFHTLAIIISDPKSAFERALGLQFKAGRGFVFALITLILSVFANIGYLALLFKHSGVVKDFAATALESGAKLPHGIRLLFAEPMKAVKIFIIITPIFVPIFLMLWFALLALAMRLLGNEKMSFGKLVALCGYAIGPIILSVIPAVGIFIGILWFLYATRYALLFYEGEGIALEYSLPFVYAIFMLFCSAVLFGVVYI